MFAVAIVALLVTMGLRGVMKARETARRLRCSQQMRDLSMATLQYEIDRRSFQGYRNVLLMTNNEPYRNTAGEGGVSWLVPLLPYLDFATVYDTYRTPGQGAAAEKIVIENLTCPSDVPSELGRPWLAYVVNTGCIDAKGVARSENSMGLPRDWPANGVFFDRYTGNPTSQTSKEREAGAKLDKVPVVAQATGWINARDGITQTLLFSENLDHGLMTDVHEAPLGMIWDIASQVAGNVDEVLPGGPPPVAIPSKKSYRINSRHLAKQVQAAAKPEINKPTYDYSRPSSVHQGGVNVAFCDGHVGFLSNDFEYFVYCLLMSADGKNVRKPGEIQKRENNWFKLPIEDAWLGE
ncbi:MAG: DUF1559 domain-containing protein [Planctomycetes bacterium]|nr:DUF1559 domain-containing protein [Planctomycetota bacterium]